MGYGSEKDNAKEIGLIWERFVPVERTISELNGKVDDLSKLLEELVDKVQQPTDSQAEAKTAANSARAYRANVKKMKEEVEEHLNSVREAYQQVNELTPSLDQSTNSIRQNAEESESLLDQIKSVESRIESLNVKITEDVNEILSLLEDNEDLQEKLNGAHQQLVNIEDVELKVQGILKNVTSNHIKVRDLKNEIMGYDAEAEDGTVEHIDGLKDELAITYVQLEDDLSKLKEELEVIRKENDDAFNEFSAKSEETLQNVIEEQKNQYDEIYDQIIRLLPTALTAGLSGAYDDKITQEKTDIDAHKKTFSKAIVGLVLISLIPFALDSYLFLYLGHDLVKVISDTPKIILSMFPLYLPILWIAYSANKKINLSKRLIEEYTHKGVLSKTYEGLSKQIDELEDDRVSTELREKLLFNILSVNAENPGKLISDYKTTDHPLMDALDKSMKLGDSVERLRNIPGFSKLVSKLDRESRDVLLSANKKSEKGLNGSGIYKPEPEETSSSTHST